MLTISAVEELGDAVASYGTNAAASPSKKFIGQNWLDVGKFDSIFAEFEQNRVKIRAKLIRFGRI